MSKRKMKINTHPAETPTVSESINTVQGIGAALVDKNAGSATVQIMPNAGPRTIYGIKLFDKQGRDIQCTVSVVSRGYAAPDHLQVHIDAPVIPAIAVLEGGKRVPLVTYVLKREDFTNVAYHRDRDDIYVGNVNVPSHSRTVTRITADIDLTSAKIANDHAEVPWTVNQADPYPPKAITYPRQYFESGRSYVKKDAYPWIERRYTNSSRTDNSRTVNMRPPRPPRPPL